ncbi:MAG TPA: methylamine utilization protein MauJ [Terriglobia bacterium]|nr:methylamine utilization protein MauJ [Terriglobia bacterium]
MGEPMNFPPGANILVFPREPTPGALGVFAKYERVEEVRTLEAERLKRVWEVRAVLSDTIPLAGDAASSMTWQSNHLFYLNEGSLWIYLHSGGRNAVYYELISDPADAGNRLKYIVVRVETRLPSHALTLARRPINALLDVFTRDSNMPLLIQRLELISPRDGAVLLTQTLVPHRGGVRLGPLGGIVQAVPFAPYDALYREALTNPSPFYRLLCAWKIYEGTQRLRRWIREQCEQRRISAGMPPDPEINRDELLRMGFAPGFVGEVGHASELFTRLADSRHAIAHFLIERDEGDSHVYLADGIQLEHYAIASAGMLLYAHRLLEDLRHFCIQNGITGRGPAILPLPENRNQFVVRASDHGMD